MATTGTPVGPFGFAGGHGYQEDGDSGLKLLGHRYYDPSTGRFLTRDPIQDGRNWYAYCDGNPLKWVDPDGHNKVWDWIKDKWQTWRDYKEKERVVKPAVSVGAAAFLLWAVWKLADHADDGAHRPPGGNPSQPGPGGWVPGPPKWKPDIPNIEHMNTRKAHREWLEEE